MSKGSGTTIHSCDKASFSTVADNSFSYISFTSGDSYFSLLIHGPDHIARAEKLAKAMQECFTVEAR
jgi:hypothetical protein